MNVKPLLLILSVVSLLAVPVAVLSDSSEGASAENTYTHPTAYAKSINDSSFSFLVESNIGYIFAHEVDSGRSNNITTNFPSWITFSSASSTVRITVNPGHLCDSVFWMSVNSYGTEFMIKFSLKVTEEDPVWGGDPDTDDPVTDPDNTIRIPVQSVWDMFAELFSNMEFLLLMAGAFLTGCFVLRMIRSPKGRSS